jgi:hypothetical protein
MDFKQFTEKKINDDQNTGFGTNANSYGGRFLNKNGVTNVKKRGISFFERTSWYHTLLTLPFWKFISIVILFYALLNLTFALIYFAIGIEHLSGIEITDSEIEKFGKAYFFSCQTFTTVGYGHISPNGFWASAVAAIEALIGLLSFALATGLFFGRFSRPRAFILFSHNAIIAPFNEGKALMIRMSTYKNTNFTNAEAKMTMGMTIEENGLMTNKFYTLDLQLSKISALTLSWTLVHPITDDSPLYLFEEDDFKNIHGEIIVSVSTFDDMYSTTVATRTSYTFEEVVYGAKFTPMYERNFNNSKTILNLNLLNDFSKVDL